MNLNQTTPLISIAIISYNNFNYLKQCIDSCLNQDYKNFEIIISDDGSNDGSQELINIYKALYPQKIQILLSSKNEGVTKNFNKACLKCNGEWIKIIAADDILKSDCLSVYADEISKKGIKNGFIFADLIIIGSLENDKISSPYVPFFNLNTDEKIKFLETRNCLPAPSVLFYRKDLHDLGYADESYLQMEDYPLWLSAAKKGVPFYYINKVTVYYRVHESLSMSIKKIGNLAYYKSLRKFYSEKIWPKRTGWLPLKNIEEYIIVNKTIISIKLFKNKKNIFYHFVDVLCQPFMLYTIASRIKFLTRSFFN